VQNQVLLLSGQRDVVQSFRSGVSIHGHTRHSRETLGFIGKFLEKRTPSRRWFEYQKEECRRITGITLDLNRAYWTPPLCERLAYDVERRQIEELGLRPMVSLTDHDTIEACTLLRGDRAFADTPISTEWTVPFGSGVFHFGIHNLPPAQAPSLMAAMREATASGSEAQIFRLFAGLSSLPGVLVVFNHPLWNFFRIPAERFDFEVERFLTTANQYIHAFELNGMRTHEENQKVLRLAQEWNQIIVSGGDRHGCEPNASLNLTNAADFPEFVDEIRAGRQSTVLIMPQYAAPLGWRLYQNFTHVIADYPAHPEGRRRWDERTFHPDLNGEIAPMIRLWHNEAPSFLLKIFAMAMTAACVPVHGLLHKWRQKENESLAAPSVNMQSSPAFASVRVSAGERPAEASLEECLYAGSGTAADQAG
jgi:hypothetical protein